MASRGINPTLHINDMEILLDSGFDIGQVFQDDFQKAEKIREKYYASGKSCFLVGSGFKDNPKDEISYSKVVEKRGGK